MGSRATTLLAGLAGLLVLALLAFTVFRGGGKGTEHELHANFDDVSQLTAGQEVRVAGRKVGTIKAVRLSAGKPVLDMEITDDQVWPFTQGTYARARFGSTTSYLLRYVELIPGPKSAPPLPEDGTLSRIKDQDAFELDQGYRIFRGKTRQQVGGTLDGLGTALGSRADQVKQAVAAGGPGFDETATFLGDLDADQNALKTLIEAGERTTGALAAHDTQLSSLIGHAGNTFDVLANRAAAQQQSLDRLPDALDESKSTFTKLDGSLGGLTQLVTDLRPGTKPLAKLAHTARGTLRELRVVAPLAASTLKRGTRTAPSLTRFLKTTTPFFPRAATAFVGLDPMVACIRPYAPELATFVTTWAGFTENYDNLGHYARTFPLKLFSGMNPGTQNTSQTALSLEPQLKYAMPRPPGLNGGTPWFLPECGSTPDSLNAAKDPEGAGR